ncbi:phage portal protein [Streptomyces sp. NBC_00385]|uniref:phage portal protein n=1 Tax=Streptomyces sp. NBC_00385 TaxID=2975733 RepID=UPI002DD9E9AD|nr:phage portal protein [Streptomyces sp. NBC_00385]WRZ05078.1 phage portal protein [Streptomyces sp. NBC_00385]
MPLIRNLLTGRTRRSRSSIPRLDGRSTSAGVNVSPDRALQVAAVFSSVRLLAETGSMLPTGVFQRSGNTRLPAMEHPLAPLLTYQANPQLVAGEFWAQVMGWMLTRGNAAVYIERNNGGRPVGLWPVSWPNVETRRVRATGELVYQVTVDDDEWAPIREDGGLVRAENLLHFRSFGVGGTEGLSPIGMARQSIGTGWAATSYIGSFFQRDASPGGTISVPGALTDGQFERLLRQWNDNHEGFDNAHRIGVMEGGAKWEKTSLSPADAQFLEVYKMTRSEIAGIYGVPPHLIGDVERSTSWGSGIEQQSLGYVIYSLMPWLTRMERTVQRLLGDPSLYMKFNPDALLRGDSAQRNAGYALGRQWGWYSVNDIRAKEDEPPIEGGDEYVVPLNMSPAGQTAPPEQRELPARQVRAGEMAETPSAEELPSWITRHFEAISAFFAEQGDRVLATLGVTPGATAEELVDLVVDNEVLTEILYQLALGLTQEVGAATAASLGGTFTAGETSAALAASAASTAANVNATTVEKLASTIKLADAPADVRKDARAMFDGMTESRARVLAQARVSQTSNFAAHEGAKQGGARTKTWRVWDANPRKTHQRADGQTVGIREDFTVGKRKGRWPHDHRLGVDEIAGCTCRLQFNREDPNADT